jgi:short-subunit dehydrogenase
MKAGNEGAGAARPVVVVTGASAGIGRAFAELYAARGYDLALTARRGDRLEAATQDLRGRFGVEVECVAADLSDPDAPAAVVKALSRPVDVLVNSAGYGVRGGFAGPAWETHAAFVQVMVTAPLALSHLVLPGMTARGWGRIVNVASVAGLIPTTPGQPLYGAAKAFMIKASLGLYLETKGKGVNVTALCPGFTRTEFHDVAGMTEALKPMPGWMWMSAEAVARRGHEAVEAGRPLCVPGLANKALVALAKLVPDGVGLALMAQARKHG